MAKIVWEGNVSLDICSWAKRLTQTLETLVIFVFPFLYPESM